MKRSEEQSVVRHIRGATVIHDSPFSSVQVPSEEDVFSEREYERWVDPFYRVSFRFVDRGFLESLCTIYQEITPSIIERLLTDYNWRPRLTGAFFAALKCTVSLQDHIGRLLVRSDLCFAGKLYCVALAEFDTETSLEYLRKYLRYYLTRPDLDYDQWDAMGAVAHLDERNETKHLEEFLPLWETFVAAKTWKPDLQKSIGDFAEEMRAIYELRAKAEATS